MTGPEQNALKRIDSATLDELMAQFPAEWQRIGARLVDAVKAGPASLETFVRESQGAAQPWRQRITKSRGNPKIVEHALPRLAAARMARLAAEQTLTAAATGRSSGPVRLGLWSGLIIQRLLFERGLRRKPASLASFRRWWPLVHQRRLLMPLVQTKGIYCFYSAELVTALAGLLRGHRCLEIAAGDGTLSRFIRDAGVDVDATDDQSWGLAVSYPPEVERLDAISALRRFRPTAVVCSFPPPGNGFERRVLGSPEIDLYVVITSRHRFAAGDWGAYEAQTAFDWDLDERLSSLVLPPEIDPAVLVFRRRTSG